MQPFLTETRLPVVLVSRHQQSSVEELVEQTPWLLPPAARESQSLNSMWQLPSGTNAPVFVRSRAWKLMVLLVRAEAVWFRGLFLGVYRRGEKARKMSNKTGRKADKCKTGVATLSSPFVFWLRRTRTNILFSFSFTFLLRFLDCYCFISLFQLYFFSFCFKAMGKLCSLFNRYAIYICCFFSNI